MIRDDDARFPEMVGQYRLHGVLGRGGMGTVFRGFHERLKRPVALKQIVSSLKHGEEARERFLREAQAAACLNHPAIVQVYDILEDSGDDWIVMELVPGTNLEEHSRSGPLPWRQVLPMAQDLASGLAAAHGAGVIHRDLKSENVILSTSGRAKILDFGLAARVHGEDSLPVPEGGKILGTPRAMAPEQILGHPLDPRCDLFSLGVLLYECLTGRSPFLAADLETTVRRVCREHPRTVREIVPEVPVEMSHLVDRLLEKEPPHRPESAETVFASLEGLAEMLRGAPRRRVVPQGHSAVAMPQGGWGQETRTEGVASQTFEERRQITVLCGEIETREPEDFYELLPRLEQLVETLAESLGGLRVKLPGPRLVLGFGYPVAHEEDACRAVKMGLRWLEEVPGWVERAGFEALTLRVAVHTGPAIILKRFAEDPLQLGETLDQVAAIARQTRPGHLVVSEATRPLVDSSFLLKPQAKAQIPGRGPLAMFRVTGEEENTLSTLPKASGPLLGREEELAEVQRCWALVQEGSFQALEISGEAGIGKTRLLAAFHASLPGPARFLSTAGSAEAMGSPFFPMQQLLRGLFHLRTDLRPADQLASLEAKLLRFPMAFEAAESMPWLASLFSLSGALEQSLPPLTPDLKKKRLLEVMDEVLRSQSRRQPTVCVVEDLHWVDPSTLEWIESLVRSATLNGLFLLLTYRTPFRPPWNESPGIVRVPLDRLGAHDTRRLIQQISGDRGLLPEVEEQVAQKTDGIPLFIEQLTRMVNENVGGAPSSPRASEIPVQLGVPASLQASLTARLDRLGSAKAVAQRASVLGREFSFELLEQVSPLKGAELRAELGCLIEAGLLARRGFSRRARFSFKHALIRDAAYESMLKRERVRIHRRIAEALRDSFSEVVTAHPEFLARHFARAEMTAEAVEHLTLAGDRALTRAANVEAVRHFQEGLRELAKQRIDREERDRVELELRTKLAPPLMATHGFGAPEVRDNGSRALELCRQMGSRLLFSTLTGLCRFYSATGELHIARELTGQLRLLARESAQVNRLLDSFFLSGSVLFHRGELRAALGLLRRGIALYEEQLAAGNHATLMHDPGVGCQAFMAWTLCLLGEVDEAVRTSRRAVAHCRRLEQPYNLTLALSSSAVVHLLREEAEEALVAAQEQMDLSLENGFALTLASGQILSGAALAALDRGNEGLRRLEEGIAEWRATGARVNLTFNLGLLAQAQGRMGRPERGLETMREALELVERSEERFFEVGLHRLRAELLLQLDPERVVEVEEVLKHALDLAHRQGVRGLGLQVVAALERLWRDTGYHEKADELLLQVEDDWGQVAAGAGDDSNSRPPRNRQPQALIR